MRSAGASESWLCHNRLILLYFSKLAGAPGFPAKKNGLFQALEKALLSGKPEIQVRQSGKTVKQTIFALRWKSTQSLSIRLKIAPGHPRLAWPAIVSEPEMISASCHRRSQT
jgi:hypothetical protein